MRDQGKIVLLVGQSKSFSQELQIDQSIRSIIIASNGKKALSVYKNFHQYQDVIVFLDVTIPDMDWRDVLKRMYAITPIPNIVVVDNKDNSGHSIEAVKRGAWGYGVRDILAGSLPNYIAKITHQPVTQKKVDDVCYADDMFGQMKKQELHILVKTKINKQFDQLAATENHQSSLLTYCLPYYQKNAMTVEACKQCIEKALGKPINELPKVTLLVIDHELSAHLHLRTALQSQYDLVLVGNAYLAKHQLRQDPKIPLILLNAHLPDQHNLELYPLFRNKSNALNGS